LIASAGFQLWPTSTCLGLKGFLVIVVVVATKTFSSKKLKQLFKCQNSTQNMIHEHMGQLS